MTETIADLIEIKISRRKFVTGLSALSIAMALPLNLKAKEPLTPTLDYNPKEIDVNVLLSWGDQIVQGEDSAKNQFGYNNDWNAYMPLDGSERGLLCVNHETLNRRLMFPKGSLSREEMSKQEMLYIGHSVVEVAKVDGRWDYDPYSKYNRRINAYDTEFEISGPAADEIGTSVIGTVNNCAGGKTPWNTILSCEENFNGYFSGEDKRYGINKRKKFAKWQNIDSRFADIDEAKRFGWVWELDPYDPNAKPVKRTALGRFKHEGATCAQAGENVVVYMGDDQAFEFLYKYIGKDLDSGTLYAAKFSENKVEWLPIPKERLVRTREAASDLGATPMDRPEDVAIDERTGEVYVTMTKNKRRKEVNIANPRINNKHGHIIKLSPQNHDDLEHGWDIFLLGNENLSCPDNLCFSNDGKLWVATDGNEKSTGRNDGLYVIDDLKNPVPREVLSVPNGAESTGLEFTPDGKTMFLSIQHPGEGSSYNNPSTRWPDFVEGKPPRPSVVTISF